MGFRETYLAAAAAYADLLDRVPDDRWDGPGLGVWSLRDLVGHTTGSGLTAALSVLDTPAVLRAVDSAEGYYAFARTVPPEVYATAVAASTASARVDGAALGADPGAAVRKIIEEVAELMVWLGDDDLVQTPAGGMRLVDWLPTRTVELVVHGLDVAAASGAPFSPPAGAVADAAAVLARLAVSAGDGVTVLRALAGRGSLPDGFGVL